MRRLLCLALLAACELKPEPAKKAPPPSPPPPAAAVQEAGSDQGAGSAAKPETSTECLDVAVKIVQVFIDHASDPAQKSVYEQARTTMVRKTSEACTNQNWSEQARSCYIAAKTPDDIKACEQQFTPPPTARPGVRPTEG